MCDGGGETTVFAHIRDRHTGRSIKASDISGADACYHCHAMFDGQSSEQFVGAGWHFYALRGIQETIENRIDRGILILAIDEPAPKATKPRKPKAQRKPIPARKTDWPSKPFPRKAKQ